MIYMVLRDITEDRGMLSSDVEFQTFFTSDAHRAKKFLDAYPGRVTVYNLANLQEIKDFEITYQEIVEETQDEAVPTSM